MGIRKRIKLGFLALGILLFIAGVFSYLEQARLNRITRDEVDRGATTVALANEIIDIISKEDNLVLKSIATSDSLTVLSNSPAMIDALSQVISKIEKEYPNKVEIDKINKRKNNYLKVIMSYKHNSSEENIKWYLSEYRKNYNELESSIRSFMRSSQNAVVAQTNKLQKSAYRAIMQGIVALASAIVLIFMFFLLIDIYFIKPVVNITKGLKNYLNMKVPFNVNVEGKDEVFMLREYIEQLIIKIKSKKIE